MLTVTINTGHSIIPHIVFQCTKETKNVNFKTSSGYAPRRTAVHGHASHPLRDVTRNPRADYCCEVTRKSDNLLALHSN